MKLAQIALAALQVISLAAWIPMLRADYYLRHARDAMCKNWHENGTCTILEISGPGYDVLFYGTYQGKPFRMRVK